MDWIHTTSWALYTTIESLLSLISQKGPPFQLFHIFPSFDLVRSAWRLSRVPFYFQYRVSMLKPMYMMTCTYDFQWHYIYVKSLILSGSHILGPQRSIISFPHNSTKKYFFSKVQLVSETDRSDLSKEPIKNLALV